MCSVSACFWKAQAEVVIRKGYFDVFAPCIFTSKYIASSLSFWVPKPSMCSK